MEIFIPFLYNVIKWLHALNNLLANFLIILNIHLKIAYVGDFDSSDQVNGAVNFCLVKFGHDFSQLCS
jgi:hypothetical protein